METGTSEIRYDEDLNIEAYRFAGLARGFPNHFHEHYVVGLIEAGERRLTVNGREYAIGPGDLITFNPMDNHACEQTDGGGLGYRCLNIGGDVMAAVAREVLADGGPPRFREPVQYRTGLAPLYRALHEALMKGAAGLEKEELFLLFVQQLLEACAEGPDGDSPGAERKEVEDVCAYLETHYAQRVTLDMLGAVAGLNKYTLLRTFARHKGITPYRYLEAVRINRAKALLEQGVEPAEAAQRTGFSDQSHFSSYFTRFTGLAPGQYQSIFRGGRE